MKKMILLALLMTTQTLWAADSKSTNKPIAFGIYPPVITLSCTPGQKMTTSLKIENPGDESARFSIEARGMVVGENSSFSYRPIASLPTDDLARHLRLEAPEIDVPAKSFKNVSIFLDVPATLKGTQYAGLTVVSLLQKAKEEVRTEEYKMKLGVGMQPALGVTIKCHMQGTEEVGYELKSVEIKAAQGNQPTRAIVEIKNTGNAELKMLPSLMLLDSSNKVVGRLKGTEKLSVLPGSVTKVVLQSLFKDVPPGQYKAIFSSATSENKVAPVEKNVLVQ